MEDAPAGGGGGVMGRREKVRLLFPLSLPSSSWPRCRNSLPRPFHDRLQMIRDAWDESGFSGRFIIQSNSLDLMTLLKSFCNYLFNKRAVFIVLFPYHDAFFKPVNTVY